jgi:branched-chain amino acid aminotransferase
VVTRGAGDLGIDPRSCPRPNIIVIARRIKPLYARKPWEGIRVVTSAFRRHAPDVLSPGIKSLNYLNNVMARIEAGDRGADEALLLDQHGMVAEATADNIFAVLEDRILTPPTPSNLKGITRETVMALATGMGFKAQERAFSLLDLWTSREAFLCGTMAEIVPIRSVDGRVIGLGTPGPVASRIAAAYEQLVRSTGTPIRTVSQAAASIPA